MPAPIVHFEIGCKDMAKTHKFYADLFGWEFQNFGGANMVTNIGPSHDGGKPKTDGIGGHLNAVGHPPHQYVTVYAQVDDIIKSGLHEYLDAFQDKLNAVGAAISDSFFQTSPAATNGELVAK